MQNIVEINGVNYYANLLLKINTKDSNEIILLERCPEEFKKTVLVIGVFHGDEPDGEYLINRYLQEYNPTQNKLLFVPCLNPDGKAKNKRTNANDVDLNRNFPTSNWEKSTVKDAYYGGEKPASELETQFLVYILEKYKPDLIITLHEPYKIINYDGPAKAIAEEFSKLTSYSIQSDIGYPTPGSFGTYCGIERNIPTITIELPEKEDKELLWKAIKPIFEYTQTYK